jgi:hypothetical protein
MLLVLSNPLQNVFFALKKRFRVKKGLPIRPIGLKRIRAIDIDRHQSIWLQITILSRTKSCSQKFRELPSENWGIVVEYDLDFAAVGLEHRLIHEDLNHLPV